MTRKSICACWAQHNQQNSLSASYTAPLNQRIWFMDFFTFSVFMCVTCVYMFACGAHVCEGGNAHGHIACGSPRLMLETIFGCFSILFPETRFSVKPSAQIVATLAHQLDLQSPCLCLTRLDFSGRTTFSWQFVGSGDLNFHPRAYIASALTTGLPS